MNDELAEGRTGAPRAYTLIEVLIVVTVMGIAAAIAAPAMNQVGVLRVQSALRTIASDISEMQSEAIAMQQQRAIVFNTTTNSYTMVNVPGTLVDPVNDAISTQMIGGSMYGNALFKNVNFNNSQTLLFDELGVPTAVAGTSTPVGDGTMEVDGSGQAFQLTVQGYTGRVVVTKLSGN